MSYHEARQAAVSTDLSPTVIAARFGISERSVYRYRRGRRPRTAVWYIEPVYKIVQKHRGDKNAIRKACDRVGINCWQRTYARDVLTRNKRIAAADWPVKDRVSNQDWKLLRAMVKAGASPAQVSRCFRIGMNAAKREIRDAWKLIEMERA